MKMNIYHLVSNKVWGGGEQYVLDLACRQRDAGHYVEIVCRNEPEVIAPFRAKEFPISTLPLKGLTDLDSGVRLARMVKKRRNTVIHVHNFKNAFTASVARSLSENQGLKIVMTRHLVKRGKNSIVYRKLYKEVDRIVFVSNLTREVFLSTNPKIDRSKLSVVHNSVLPTPTTEAVDLHSRFGIAPEKAIILFHGRISPEKGIDVLLRAVSQLPREKYHLLIFGEGKKHVMKKLREIIVSNNIGECVTFAGYQTDIQPFVRSCDIAVQPSVMQESLGLANLESMMWSRAVVTTNNGAQPEYIVAGRDGILVDPGNPYALADALSRLIASPELRRELGEAAKKRFETDFAYPRFFDAISNIYNHLWDSNE